MTGYCSSYGTGQQQKILSYRNCSVVQDTSHPDQLFIIHDCLTALTFCVVAKQRETDIVSAVTETCLVCIATETDIALFVTETDIALLSRSTNKMKLCNRIYYFKVFKGSTCFGRSPYGHINQRLQIQFRALVNERCAARNILRL
jgi:hypothetical protein